VQLREKQKVKRMYGVLERQFRGYFKEAERRKGITGENLLVMLERRLDNVVYSLGFASSRAQARQLVRHGHIRVDDRKTTIASYQVRQDQAISVRDKSRKNEFIRASVESARGRGIPSWLELDPENFSGKVLALPTREDIKLPVDSSAKILPDGLLGGNFIALEPGAEEDIILSGGRIEFTQSAINVVELISRFVFNPDAGGGP